MRPFVNSSFKIKRYKQQQPVSIPVQLNSLNMLKALLKNFAFTKKKLSLIYKRVQ